MLPDLRLGDFLKSRRARLRPRDVGLPAVGVRRVPGLRRAEAAKLAGVSVDYYVRLEQDRAGSVSLGVLEAVAAALRMDPDEREYLVNLAHPPIRHTPPLEVDTGVRQLLDGLTGIPAYALGRSGEVLAWNDLAARVFLDASAVPPERRTTSHLLFCDDALRGRLGDWEDTARSHVGRMRLKASRWPDDDRLRTLIGHMRDASPDFRRLWERHDVTDRIPPAPVLHHADAGALPLLCRAMAVTGRPGLEVVAYPPHPGTDARARLDTLR
ncbi:helix-turn-helix transcriptional regulator [Yinghuangia seranimata]|uniref:helix-turn-helix transcriptional regulator n=1 Tax=Yinghuangia seranimata TaxID=408067 RepID=UPI00248AFB1D|nr:helix-turn-helix transcriptional regulator [Yinghuangia seranimata]MDI2130658.1 helix-turn-helix transcriptional regulator [Yinghuangia seranimata]